MRRLIVAPLAVLLLVAFASACDGGGGDTEETPTLPPPVTQAPATDTPAPIETTTPTESVQGECSAAGRSPVPEEQQELPPAVAELREQIVAAAVACDYDRLEELALQGDPVFAYSFGEKGESEPAAYWRQAEAQGKPVLASLVEVLNLPPGLQQGVYAWPFAYWLDFSELTDAAERLLEEHFTAAEIADWKAFGGYIGYRAIITQDGDWTAFIAGD